MELWCDTHHLNLRKISNMPTIKNRVSDKPHYRIEAYNLATWIEDQGEDTWWSVDGDQLLMSRLSFPCPADELVTAIQAVGKPLFVLAAKDFNANGSEISPDDVERLAVFRDQVARRLNLCWIDSYDDWELTEYPRGLQDILGPEE